MPRASLDDEDDGESSTAARPIGPPPPRPTSLVLEIIGGPDAGRRVALGSLENMRALIGQSPVCEIRLTDREVSRRHAALELGGPRVRITDLGSTNGTMIQGVSIVDAFLDGGAVVRLGSTAFRVTSTGAGAPTAVLASATHFGHVVGVSPQMRRLYPLFERLAASSVPVVIEGETGTGKEVLAEALHGAGPRARGPFVVFDCTAVPANLVESELFGHERGAFTGAGAPRKGLLEQADGGTLFIDEIGDLDIALQPKLLRAVERREVRRLGGDRSIRVDARILVATRRDLDREVQAGRFRDDLFHRLAVTRIELPPLRAREGDVVVLARHVCREIGADPDTLPAALLARWVDSSWPGNIRELRNAVARWVALGDCDGAMRDECVDARARETECASRDFLDGVLALRLPLTKSRQQMVDAFERRYVDGMLTAHDGHVGRAAAASGVGRRYFQMLLARHS